MRRDVPPGHPDFGRLFPCRCTLEEFERGRQSRLERHSNLGALSRFTFEFLEEMLRGLPPSRRERLEEALEEARRYARERKGWLVLSGPSGSGKTALAAAVANHCLREGIPTLFMPVPDLLDHLRAAFSPGSEISYDELFERVRTVPLLVLDDLGFQITTPWAEEKLFQLLNHRYNVKLPTVIAVADWSALPERILTRIANPEIAVRIDLGEKPKYRFHGIGFSLETILRMTFDNFDLSPPGVGEEGLFSLERAVEAARRFAEDPRDWLVLAGPHGCGKTHLACAIAQRCLERGEEVVFAAVPDLLDALRPAASPEERWMQAELFEKVKNAPILVLDDFRVSGDHRAREKLYQLVNYRYNMRLPTVFTTFLKDEEIERLEEGLGLKLLDPRISLVIAIMAPDYRLTSSKRPIR